MEKISSKLKLWKAKLLSRAGRINLIKSVLNNLLMYYISLFKMPKGVIDKIIRLQRNFFAASDDKRRGIPLVKWEIIQKPKNFGGLGVGDLVIKNNVSYLNGG